MGPLGNVVQSPNGTAPHRRLLRLAALLTGIAQQPVEALGVDRGVVDIERLRGVVSQTLAIQLPQECLRSIEKIPRQRHVLQICPGHAARRPTI